MYLVKNKHTQAIEPIGSIAAVSGFTKIKENALYNTFSRKKLSVHEDENFHIERKRLIRQKRIKW